MHNKKLHELINKEIDGLNTPEESKQLRDYMRKNPEAHDLYNDLRNLSESLEKVKKISPPPNLRKTILNTIDMNKYAKKERRPHKFFKFLSRYRFNLQYAYIFIAGMALGVFIYYSLLDTAQESDTSHLIGTMIINETSASLEPISKIQINLNDISGTVSLKSEKNILFVEFKVKTKRDIQTVIDFGQDDIGFLALSRLNKNSLKFEVNKKTIHIRHKGDSNYIVFLTEPVYRPPQLNLKLYADDNLLVEENLFLKKEN